MTTIMTATKKRRKLWGLIGDVLEEYLKQRETTRRMEHHDLPGLKPYTSTYSQQ